MRIYHYTVHAYDSITPEGSLLNVSEITINHALDESNAIEQARKLINRPLYRLSKIWECHSCASQDNEKTQKELQKETIKFLKKHNHDEDEEI